MKWQCSTKDLLIGTAIVAIGLAGFIEVAALVTNFARTAIAICSLVVIGIGLLTPFHKKRLGAVLGLVLPNSFALIMHLLGIRF